MFILVVVFLYVALAIGVYYLLREEWRNASRGE